MTFEEGLNNLIELQKDYQQFHDDVWQDPESYGIIAESLRIGIDTMRKYQKIEQIMKSKKMDALNIGLLIPKDMACVLHEIKGVIEDAKTD